MSILRGDQIVNDALDTATVKLSSDRSWWTPPARRSTSPSSPPAAPGPRRQTIEAANAFYDWRTKVDESDRFVFEDRTGEGTGGARGTLGSSSFFEDASSASGDDVFNKVIVSGQ